MILAVVAALAAAGPSPFTLEQVLAAPFPNGLVAAPGHGKVAWVMNAKGVRNVWVAEAPEYRGRVVTRFTEDDGEEIGDLAFTADATAVVFVRGGAPNRAGEIPNPLSRPEARERAIHLVRLEGLASQGGAGGAAAAATPSGASGTRRLAEGHSPLPHPKEARLVFVEKNQVFGLDLAEGAKPERLFGARGGLRSLRFSRDGARLAFVSDRGDHAFVAVFDLAAKTVRWLDPGVDQDGEPAFSPDGKSVAFLRRPAQKSVTLFGAIREGEPWSIRVADLATRETREVFRADRGRGSAFQDVVAENQILWAGDRLVFPWEKTGWLHLYSVPAGGGPPVALTQGAFEVEYVTAGLHGTSVVYNSNEGDVDRRHIWTVPAKGGKPARLTSEAGIQWSPVLTGDGGLAYLRSSATRPAHPCLKTGDEAAVREMAPGTIPPEFPEAALVEPEAVTIVATDGMRIPTQLFKPRGLKAGERRPAVIFFHGGSRRQMLLGFHYMDYYHYTYAMNQYLASRGYVVLSVNYRSGIGYGLEFREALGYGPTGASEMADVAGAGLYLKARADVDPAAIGLWGGSYGGYLTALGLARASDLFAAGVDIHGCHDWNVVIKNFVPSYEPLAEPEVARRAFESSPLASVKSWRSPVLLVHADDDRNVPFSETVTLAEALRKQGVAFETLVYPDDVHDFLLHARWREIFERSADFFDRHLKRQVLSASPALAPTAR
jgi:dipeptidyl aminopeptidase/acylaminoacyl peptidase